MPRSLELEATGLDRQLALVAIVTGTRPFVSTDMVRAHLVTYFGIGEDLVSVRRHDPEDFIVRFAYREDLEVVLHTVIHGAPFSLIWHPWRRTSLVSAGAFYFRVLVGMKRVPLHARSLAVAQAILGTACTHIKLAPQEVTPSDDDREFFVAAWCLDLSFIPNKKILFISEPNARISGNALYLEADEVVLNKLPRLHYLVRLCVIEYQDWSTPLPSSDDEGRDIDNDEDSDSSNHNGCHPWLDDHGERSLGPGYRSFRFANRDDAAPQLGGRHELTFQPC